MENYFMSTKSAFEKIHEMFNANNTKRTEGFDMVNIIFLTIDGLIKEIRMWNTGC
jgi:hypothetical protein